MHVSRAPVAIFPWGDVIEEFLDPLGLSAQDYAGRMGGGWLFGYVAALQACGRGSVLIHASERVSRPERLIHAQTGAPIWLVPGRRSGEGRTRGRPSRRAAAQWARTPWRDFTRVLRTEGCGAVMIQDYEHARFDALVMLSRGLGLPAYATFQGGDVTLSPLEGRVRGLSLRRCRALVIASARERDRLGATYGVPRERLLDIPNPVDAEAWRAEPRGAARRAMGIEPGAFLVVNHGRIDILRKGLDVLMRAWAEFARLRPRARLVIIGSGQDHEAFARLAADAPQVNWISSYLTDPTLIRRWLSAADAYVTLSRLEGMPVAPLEAMACGLPVVASDAHGLADIFGAGESSGGLLAPREAPAAAARALQRLADDATLRARLGAAARASVEARYSIPAVGKSLSAAFGPSAGRRPEARPVAGASLGEPFAAAG